MRIRGLSYGFSPVNGDVGTINVRGGLVFQVLEARVARFLGEAGLIAEIEEAADAVLTGLEGLELNEAEATGPSQHSEQK